MGCVVIAEALRLLKERDVKCGVFAVANVQEEIGLRGARTAAHAIEPTVGIATDVCHAMDFPGADKKKVGDIKLGAGPVIARGANINPRVFDLLVTTAKKLEIPFQIEAVPGGTGTDANAMQVSRSGMATGLISVPLRYMHTPCEVMDLNDIDNAALLMAGFVEAVTPDINWVP
jgi:endoglucanase